jgi:hypothetical protein
LFNGLTRAPNAAPVVVLAMPRALSNGLTDVRAAVVRDDFADEIIGPMTSIRANTECVGECRDRRPAADL